MAQVIAGLKSDIEALENQSYELQQVRDQLDTRRSHLEAENHDLAMKRENLTGKQMIVTTVFVELCPEMIFACLSDLKYCFLGMDKIGHFNIFTVCCGPVVCSFEIILTRHLLERFFAIKLN